MAEFESCSKCKFDGKSTHDFPCNECVHNAREHFRPKSNADKIRAMSDEELADFLTDHHNYPCKYCVHCWKDSENDVGCKRALMRWLKSEAKE